MQRKVLPFAFSYRFDYVPSGKRKAVSTELEGRAFGAIDELAAEDAPVAIQVRKSPDHGNEYSFVIRSCGNDLLWPVQRRDGSCLTADAFTAALAEGAVFLGPDDYSVKQRGLSTIDALKVRRHDYLDSDKQITRVQRRLAQLRICDGTIWVVGTEPVYFLDDDRVRLWRPPSPKGMFTVESSIRDENAFHFAALRGDVFSLDEFELAPVRTHGRGKPKRFVEVRGWCVRTDAVQLQVREVLRALVSAFLRPRLWDLPTTAQRAVGRILDLDRSDSAPSVEESVGALTTLADLCETDEVVAAHIGDAVDFIRTSIEDVVRSCTIRGRQPPFQLSDDEDRALGSL